MNRLIAGLLVGVALVPAWSIQSRAAAVPEATLTFYSEGLEALANGQWDRAANAFQAARTATPDDPRFPLAHAVSVGLGGKFQDAVLELQQLPKVRNGRRNREPELWTYVFETMGGFATAGHSIGGARYGQSETQIVPNQAVSMPGNMVQGEGEYPTDFASFVYYELAMNGYARPRQFNRAPDPSLTSRLRLEAGRWFAARFQASPDLAQAHLARAKNLNAEHRFAESLAEIHYARIPFPADSSLAFFTADDWLGLGRPITARREATFALTAQTVWSGAYLDRAVAAARVGDRARAESDLSIATQLNSKAATPFDKGIHNLLAKAEVHEAPLNLLSNLEHSIRSGAPWTNVLMEAEAFHRAAGAHRKRYDEIYQDRLRELEAAVRAHEREAAPRVALATYLSDESRVSRRSEAVEPRRAPEPYREQPNPSAELNRAVRLCDQALGLEPKDVRAFMVKAMALSRLGRDDEAEPIVDQALAVAPKDPEALRMRAQYWTQRAGGLSLQAASLRTPRTVSNSHTENRSDGVYLVTVTTSYPPTAADLNRASQLEAAAAELYHRSEAAINAALQVTKGTFEGELLLAQAQIGRGDSVGGEATLKKAIAERPNSTEAREDLINLYLITGRNDEADLERSDDTQLFQTSAGWLLKQAWKQIVARDFTRARSLLERARQLDPEDARVPAYLGVLEQGQGQVAPAQEDFLEALVLEEGRLALDEPDVQPAQPAPQDALNFGLSMKLRQVLAASLKPASALRLYLRNTALEKLFGPGQRATEMFTAMLPEPGAQPIPVPAPVNLATLLAESHLGAGKALQALGRTADAEAQFAAATAYGPKAGVPNVGGFNRGNFESNFAGNAGGRTAEAYLELAKSAIRQRQYQAAAKFMSQATELHIPRDRLEEANDIQMQIAHGMSGY